MDSGETLTHITDVSPENMLGGKISKSHNMENHYNTERGNWVFASSEPVDGTNVYMARKSKDGLMIIAEGIYIYGGDNMKIEQDDQGKNHVMLKSPNYIYKINPKNFTPVVTLMESPEKKPYFDFSQEWISDDEVDINNLCQVSEIRKITDVTEIIENYQIFCDVNKNEIAKDIRLSTNKKEAISKLFSAIKSGDLRYINGESKINVNEEIKSNLPIASAVEKSEEECTEEDLKTLSKCVQLLTSRDNKNEKEGKKEVR